jgi:undecaprenyl-diphosphatase
MIETLINFDHKLFVFVNQTLSSTSLDGIMSFLSSKWMFIPIYIIAVLKMVQIYKKRFWMPVLLCLLAFGLADSMSSKIFKPAFKRVRPAFCETMNPRLPDGKPGGHYGFVSSHAANTFAVYPLIVVLLFSQYSKKTMRLNTNKKYLFIAFFVSGLVAYSRVYNGVHWPADVFFGGILGLLICYSCVQIWKNWLQFKALNEI